MSAGLQVAFIVALGALASRTFVWLLLEYWGTETKAIVGIGALFLVWPGLIDALTWLATNHTYFDAATLIAWATISGGLVGFWDGLHQIHDWRKRAGLTFLADVTWGSAGSNLGLLVHFLNLHWGRPAPTVRLGAHCYDQGVCFSPAYAFALGNVCGNLRGRGDGPLMRHELVHVFQNRVFGPVYPFTYVLWATLLLVPAVIWGVFVGRPKDVIYSWCYANNPWEEWAYRHGGSRPAGLVWPTRRIVAVAIALL